MKIAYMAGPGNVRGALELLEQGEDDVGLSHVGYSTQMLRAAARLDAREVLMFTDGVHKNRPTPDMDRNNFDIWGMRVRVVQLKKHYAGKRGVRFHLASIAQAMEMRQSLRRFKPDYLIASDEPNRAVALEAARTPGCHTVRVHHCAVWPWMIDRFTPKQAACNYADMMFAPDAALSASRVVSCQLQSLYGQKLPIAEFLPSFDEHLHYRLSDLPAFEGELHVAYIGRIERYKGVMDLAEVASLLRHAGQKVFFHVCGDGDAMPELRQFVADRKLTNITLNGNCDRLEMQQILRRCHMGIVPTRTEFGEGFCQAAVEHMLSGRPVLTSAAVPGLPYLGRAAYSVPAPDSVAYYCAALVTLLHHPHKLQQAAAACKREVQKFFDVGNSYEAAMIHVLNNLSNDFGVKPPHRFIGFSGGLYAQMEEASAKNPPTEAAA